jgi:pimeloyl-ACP methyl ester carboxylesterase
MLPITPPSILSIILIIIGFAAMIGFAVSADIDENYVSAAWVSGLTLYFSFQALLRENTETMKLSMSSSPLPLATKGVAFCHVFGLVIAFCLFIMYAIGHSAGACIFSITLFCSHGLVLFIMKSTQGNQLPADKPTSSIICVKRTNGFFLGLAIVLQGLLLGGAGVLASGYAMYSPRGTFVTYHLSDGRAQTILYDCQGGPVNRTNATNGLPIPIIWIDSDASHGAADFWPMQRELVNRGYRTCVYDKPGLGWSQYYYPDQPRTINGWQDRFFNATGEKPPYMLIGWGGGSDNVVTYMSLYPEKVTGVVVLDMYADGVEWRQEMKKKNLTPAQIEAYRREQLDGRFGLFALIRALAVEWGIMSFFLNPDTKGYAWAERFQEYRWFYLVGKTWLTQYLTLRDIDAMETSDPYQSPTDRKKYNPEKIPKSIIGKPLLSITSDNHTDVQVCTPQPGRGPMSASDCADKIYERDFLLADVLYMYNITGNGKLAYCSDTLCDLGFALRFPEVVADEVVKNQDFLFGW